MFGQKHWDEPGKWNAAAASQQKRKRVFCASMADVFEARTELNPQRRKLWLLIESTPWLDWLLLTKRPQNISSMIPWGNHWPENIWLGTTVEDQQRASERLPYLLQHSAKRRFLSCEPLVDAVDLSPWIAKRPKSLHQIDWVIAGGESGAKARPMFPGWARQLRDQCNASGIPFHFKQWGHWSPVKAKKATLPSTAKQFWDAVAGEEVFMQAKGKKESGRHLDGVTWDELP